jgi:gliding motility-associated-like protein
MGHILDASHNVDNASISWSTPDGNILSGSNAISPHVNEPGIYTITVTNLDNGCEDSASMQVHVVENYDLDLSQLTIPNVITPGTDNKNDNFRMFLANDPQFDVGAVMEEFGLSIFDRWGNLIYESSGQNRSWNGRVNGEISAPGTYYYLLSYEVECGVSIKESVDGSIELLVK